MSAALSREIKTWSRQLTALLDRGEQLLERARGASDPIILDPVQRQKVEIIIETVCRYAGTTRRQLIFRGRAEPLCTVRQIAMTILRARIGLSSTQVADIFHRDHGTVLHAEQAINNRISTSSSFAVEFGRIKTEVENQLKNL